MRFSLLILIWIFLTFKLGAQDLYRTGLLPVFNVNVKFENDYSLNAKLENRQVLSRGSFSSDFYRSEYRFERQDLALIGAKKLSANISAAIGYLGRLESERFIHRAIQQISFAQTLRGVRLAHRVRTDQTWDPEEPFEFRARYRFGVEYPLAGTELDPKELYLKSTFEYLARFQDGFLNEVRAVPVLGYLAKDKNAFELGIDYRFESIFKDIRGHGFWLYFGYYLRIDTRK